MGSEAKSTPSGITATGAVCGRVSGGFLTARELQAQPNASHFVSGVYCVTPVEMPFGGFKQSGVGKENSRAALDHYSQIKSVYVEMEGVESPF